MGRDLDLGLSSLVCFAFRYWRWHGAAVVYRHYIGYPSEHIVAYSVEGAQHNVILVLNKIN